MEQISWRRNLGIDFYNQIPWSRFRNLGADFLEHESWSSKFGVAKWEYFGVDNGAANR